jgi:aspartokinase
MKMVTIANYVEKLVKDRPFIEDALCKGLINMAALSEELKPYIEKEMKKDIKFSAINMAIRRYAEKIEKSQLSNVKFDENSDITIKSNLISVTLYKTSDIEDRLDELKHSISPAKGDFLTITRGIHEIMIITNSKFKNKLESSFNIKQIKKIIDNLCSISINIPEESIESIGLFYLVTKQLTWENIPIIDIVSTLTEMTFIIKESNVAKSFETLNKLIYSNKSKK